MIAVKTQVAAGQIQRTDLAARRQQQSELLLSPFDSTRQNHVIGV